MKKMLLAVIAVGLMSTSAIAGWYEGTVQEIRFYSPSTTILVLNRTSDSVNMALTFDSSLTEDAKKTLIAMLLTAKTTGNTVEAYLGGSGFNSLKVK